MQTKPRLLVNLLVKLTRMNPNGGHGGGGLPSASSSCQLGPGNTLGRGSYLGSASNSPAMALGLSCSPAMARLLAILVISARLLAILARLCQLYYRSFGLSLGDYSQSQQKLYSHLTTCSHICVFFSDDVLWGNYLIKNVVLFEENSILVFPECLEASEWQFLQLEKIVA